jgi:hypothetical protein
VKFIVVTGAGDYRAGEFLQILKGSAVQVVIDPDGATEDVFIWWPDVPSVSAGKEGG